MTTTFEIQRQAIDHLRAGRFAEAEQVCRQILVNEPQHAEALHLLGVALHHRGQFADAIECLERAIAQNGSQAAYHNNLGNALKEQGRAAEAVECFRAAIRLQPGLLQAHANLGSALATLGKRDEAIVVYRDLLAVEPRSADAHYCLAAALAEQNQLDEAIGSLRRAIELRPNFLEALFSLGKFLKVRGQLDEAAQIFQRVLAQRPNFAAAHYQLGDVRRLQGRAAEALSSLEAAVRHDPRLLVAHNQLGNLLRELGKLDEAAAAYAEAIKIDPLCAEAHSNLGSVYNDQGRIAEAIACQREALRIQPNLVLAHSALGTALQAQGDLTAARASYQRALEMDPRSVVALHNLAMSLLQVRESAAACERFEQMLQIDPDNAQAHYWIGVIRLAKGDFKRGWPEYEWRRKTKFSSRELSEPLWTGEPLEGRKILIHAEWGLGDTLQFIRYAPLVQARGGDVSLMVQRTLMPILRQSVFEKLSATADPPPACDVQVPMLSLPGIFGTTVETIPASIPYLAAQPELGAKWRERLQPYSGFKVGIHWHGSKTSVFDARSLRLEQFEPLARVPGTVLVSLQKGAGAQQIAQLGGRFDVVDFGDEIDREHGPFMDTAAIMANMDLVITNDTAIAHLAGGLGARVWVALNYSAAWIWLEGREDSPWYPTMRLFWQARFDDWSEPFERMTAALGGLVASR